MTNGSLKTGTGQARPLADACHSRDADRIEPWVTKVAKQLEAESEDIREFLMVLSIEAGLPGKDHLGWVDITELVVPACETLKLDPSLAQGCYQRIVAAIARANRDAVGDPIDLLEVVGDPNRLDEEATHDRRLRRRRLDRDLIASLIFPPVTSVAQLGLGADNLDAPAASRLRQKLEAGGLGPTVVDTAVELRASWYGFESSRRNDLPGGDPFFDDLRLRVRELAGLSESRVADPRHQYRARAASGPAQDCQHASVATCDAVSHRRSAPSRPHLPTDGQLQGLVVTKVRAKADVTTLAGPLDPLDYHVARVLLLVAAFSGGASDSLDGLTKLAKLDFLLRYPVYLEKTFDERGKPLAPSLRPTREERQALESAMIRYKYGPCGGRTTRSSGS